MHLLAGLVGAALVALPTALPVITPVWAAPHPVAPHVTRVDLAGVDAAALAAAPAALAPRALLAADRTPAGAPGASGSGAAAPAVTARAAAGDVPAVFTGTLSTPRFTAAGVTWSATGAPADVVVQVRVKERSGWSGWTRLAVAGGPDAGSADARRAAGRRSTEPVSTAGATGVQVRVDSPDGTTPRGLQLVYVDPGTSAADANPSGRPAASAQGAAVGSRPTIITRAQWGADESLRDCDPTYAPTVRVAFVHHTVTTNSYAPGDSAGIIRGIYAFHVQGNGWCDLGYNVVVDKYGQVFEGRAGGVDRPVLGAHTLAFNWDSFGVAALGDYSAASPSSAMLGSISSVVGWKLGLYGRNPGGQDRLTSAGGDGARWPAGTVITFNVVSGHRDAWSTDCPGARLYGALASIRQSAYARLVSTTRTVDDLYAVWGTTQWPPSGRTELHVQSGASGFAARAADVTTKWGTGNPAQWRYFIGSRSGDTRPDLIGVQTAGTRSGRLEVHEASWASGYQDTDTVTATPFAAGAQAQVAVGGPGGGNLYVVYPNRSTGRVEIHGLSASSGWNQWVLHSSTVVPAGYFASTTRFLVSDNGDLYVVLHGSTGSGRSEIHVASAVSGYAAWSLHVATTFEPTSDTSSRWVLGSGARPDVYWVPLTGTSSGRAEVWRLSAAASYRSAGRYVTSLPTLAFPAAQIGVG
ncbi:hypothetical protein GCM10009814_14970 [Lapillicoccus jejuensis]